MKSDTDNMLSVSEANQDFSREQAQFLADEELFSLSDKLMEQNKKVYEELAK
jgi:hypothetical protein